MEEDKKLPEDQRERIRQQEWKNNNPTGNLNDSINRASYGSLVELVGGLGWKGSGILILAIV